MCKQVVCPNDGKPTWWGCVRVRNRADRPGGHIEIALAGVLEADRCQCEHVPVEGKPGVYEVPKRKEGGEARTEVAYERPTAA